MKHLWSASTAQDLPHLHSLLQPCSAFFWFVCMLGNLEPGQRNEKERRSLARAVGREIAGWEGILWFGQQWRELGDGHALPDTEETKELLCVLPLLIFRLRQQNCLGFLIHSTKVLLQHFTPVFNLCSFSTEL